MEWEEGGRRKEAEKNVDKLHLATVNLPDSTLVACRKCCCCSCLHSRSIAVCYLCKNAKKKKGTERERRVCKKIIATRAYQQSTDDGSCKHV